jgi:uncharacterized protein YcsI (UPF0317 family)
MGKVILLVVIAYTNHPSITYRAATAGMSDCYAQAAMLAKAPPIDEDVTKYMIGCSFEEPIPDVPL